MPELRISDLSAGTDSRRRVRVTWQDGMVRRVALDNFEQAGPGAADRADRERRYIAQLEQRTR